MLEQGTKDAGERRGNRVTSAAEKAEAMTINRLMNFPMGRLDDFKKLMRTMKIPLMMKMSRNRRVRPVGG